MALCLPVVEAPEQKLGIWLAPLLLSGQSGGVGEPWKLMIAGEY